MAAWSAASFTSVGEPSIWQLVGNPTAMSTPSSSMCSSRVGTLNHVSRALP